METNLVLAELAKGPASKEPEEFYLWLFRIHEVCSKAQEPSVRVIAPPLAKAMELLRAGKELTEAEKAERERAILMLTYQAQVLVVFACLEELNKFRNVIAAETAKLKPDSKNRKKGQELQAIYERTIDAMALAYDQMRTGDVSRFEEARQLMIKAGEAAAALKK
jgi:hypothetical protein